MCLSLHDRHPVKLPKAQIPYVLSINFKRRLQDLVMKTKVIENRWLPFPGFTAITLFGFVFTRDRKSVTPDILNHELIHCRQQLELLYIPFFILYLLEWLLRLIQYRDSYRAYRNISFEREAYTHEADHAYPLARRPHAWLRHLTRKSKRQEHR